MELEYIRTVTTQMIDYDVWEIEEGYLVSEEHITDQTPRDNDGHPLGYELIRLRLPERRWNDAEGFHYSNPCFNMGLQSCEEVVQEFVAKGERVGESVCFATLKDAYAAMQAQVQEALA